MLAVDKLSFTYPLRPLWSGVSFGVNPGELVHVKGHNGCGKSTLVKVLVGLLPAGSGQVLWQDRPLTHQRSSFAYLPAEVSGLIPSLDALSNLKFFLGVYGLERPEAELKQALKRYGLSPFPFLSVSRFSTGMKRRLALLRLELLGVPLWFLDEPMYGLDSNGVEIFTGLLHQHLDAGGCAVMVSHDDTAFAGAQVHRTIDLEQYRKRRKGRSP